MAFPTVQAAGIITEVYNFSNLNTPIPDGNPSGLASFQAVTGSAISTIQEVKVSLDITGTFKLRKVDLQAQGYDPARFEDELYLLDHAGQCYAPYSQAGLDALGIAPYAAPAQEE